MDPELVRLIEASTPKLNPAIANGLAQLHLEYAEAYVDSIFRAVANGFPAPFEYVKGTRCLPQEEFNEITRKKGSRRTFDVAVSYIYMMEYTFRNGPDVIKRYMHLPYAGDAGEIYLGGSRFVISPVLADRVISKSPESVFIRLNRARLTFERLVHHFMVDVEQFGQPRGRRETAQVCWSLIYNRSIDSREDRPTVKAKTTLGHYLFCKYGFDEAFKRTVGFVPVVGTHETINNQAFNEQDWVICASTQFKPVKTYTSKLYNPTKLRLAIPRAQFNATVRNLVCDFFYIVDHFPDEMLPEYVNNTRQWKILMGRLLFPLHHGVGRMADDIDEHIGSLDEYIDEVMKVKFNDINLPIDDIYQLFAIIIERFNEWVLEGEQRINSLYDKELSILYYVLDEITKQINKFYFKLKAASKKGPVGTKEIISMMNQTIKPGLVFSITKKHGEVSTISAPGDNKAFKITSVMVPQAASNKALGRADSGGGIDPSKFLHASVADIGGYSNLPKSDPSGHSRINPYLKFTRSGVVLPNPQHAEMLKAVQEDIKRN